MGTVPYWPPEWEHGPVTSGHDSGERSVSEPRKRRLGRPPTLDRDAALRAARDVIAQRGFDRTRYADVAEAAAVPVTTLQHAFGSLQAMLLESVQRSTASEIAVLRDLSQGVELSPWERLAEFVTGAVGSQDHPDTWAVWLELWRLAGRDPEIGAHAGVVYAQWWDYVAELISLGVDAGQFTSPITERPYDAAQAAVAVVDGLAAALVVRADGPDHDRVLDVSLQGIAALLGYERDDVVPVPALAISVKQGASDDDITVDGPVPPAEPISAEGPLPDLPVGREANLPPGSLRLGGEVQQDRVALAGRQRRDDAGQRTAT